MLEEWRGIEKGAWRKWDMGGCGEVGCRKVRISGKRRWRVVKSGSGIGIWRGVEEWDRDLERCEGVG